VRRSWEEEDYLARLIDAAQIDTAAQEQAKRDNELQQASPGFLASPPMGSEVSPTRRGLMAQRAKMRTLAARLELRALQGDGSPISLVDMLEIEAQVRRATLGLAEPDAAPLQAGSGGLFERDTAAAAAAGRAARGLASSRVQGAVRGREARRGGGQMPSFDDVDANGDGVVDAVEWEAMVKQAIQ